MPIVRPGSPGSGGSLANGLTIWRSQPTPLPLSVALRQLVAMPQPSGVAWNILDKNDNITLSDDLLTASASAAPYISVRSTQSRSWGKWYFEVLAGGAVSDLAVGITNLGMSLSFYPGGGDDAGYLSDGRIRRENTTLSTETAWTAGDVIGVALDVDTRTVGFYKNNVWQGGHNFNVSVAAPPWFAAWAGGTGTGTLRTKTTQFTYAPPTGYTGFDETTTFAIDPGVYTLTGTDVGLTFSRSMPITPGAYTLTGTAVNLLATRILPVDPGTYALTGTAVGLLFGHLMSVAPGSYSLTGTDVALTYTPNIGYTLAIDPGAYALTGATTGLLFGRVLAVTPGAYALTGTAVGLLLGFSLPIVPGTYALTGAALTFPRGYVIAVTPGAYVLTGTAIGLLFGRSLPVTPGAYSLSGAAVGLNFGRAIGVTSGSYALTGAAIGFTYMHVLGITPGAYALSGAVVGLLTGRNLAITPGSYNLTGSSVLLTYSGAAGATGGPKVTAFFYRA